MVDWTVHRPIRTEPTTFHTGRGVRDSETARLGARGDTENRKGGSRLGKTEVGRMEKEPRGADLVAPVETQGPSEHLHHTSSPNRHRNMEKTGRN